MVKARFLFMIGAISFATASNGAPTDWNNPDDIPIIEPVTVGEAGKKPADIVRYLLAQGATSAALSPDGQTLAYRWSVTGEPQLWAVSASGGWPQQITFGSGITFFEWTPNGKHLIVGRDVDGNEREGYFLISTDGTHERAVLPLSDAFRQFGMFSSDGRQILFSSTERNGTDFDIYVGNIENSESRQVYESSFGFFPVAWQPEGDLVIVSETRGEDANDVHLLDMSNGRISPLFQPEVAAAYGDFAWLPDGSGFYVASNVDREFIGLAFYSFSDEKLTYVETPDFDISNVVLSGDGQYLVWTSNEDGYSKLHVLNRHTGEPVAVPDFPAGTYTVGMARDVSVVSLRVSAPGIPGDVLTWNLESNEFSTAVRSSLGGLNSAEFVTPLSLRYPARDGVELQGYLYLPRAGDFPYTAPVVVDVHGGPTAQSRPSFKAVTQYLVNQGIAVFAVNVRGSTGFGKTYTRLDNREKRLDSVRDLVDTVAFLKKNGKVDTRRVAVMGGSYGGYMVNAVLGEYPGVFDAGVSMVGVSDWVRALRDASPALKASDRIEYGDIREPYWQTFYAQNSPINNAHKIVVPMLVQHGANDPRDPVTESDRIVAAARAAGNEVIYMRFPDEGHGLTKQRNRVAYFRTLARFLEKHLLPASQDKDQNAPTSL